MTGVPLRFGPYRLYPAERQLEREGRPVVLGSRALDLLIALAERAGEVVPRRELIDRVWPDLTVEESNLRVHVAGLRKALGEGAEGATYIANVPGRGYCFVAPIETSRAAPAPALTDAPRAISSLPPRLSRMVGREQTVAALVVLLRERRFVSVIGPGGMGKTTVATAVAHELADSFEGQIAFVDFTTLADSGLVTAFVSAAVGATLTEPDPLVGLLAFVANRRMLIVLDNCEHLADAVAALARQLYTRASELHLLVTSREALRTEGEQVHTLEPLEGPPDHDAAASELLKFPAVQLFIERAVAGGHREPLDDAAAKLVAGMCQRLDGMPLAIELVASRLRTYGVEGAAELLENRFRLLWQERRSALPRHQTLHAMLDWSFSLLSERDRTIFARLGVLDGPFNREAARAVAEGGGYDAIDVDRSLNNLVEKSLVWTSASTTSPLYRLPHVTREFALAELAKRDEKSEVSARHARYVLNLLEAARSDGPPVTDPPVSSLLPPHLRAALDLSFSKEGDPELAVDLVVAATPQWLRTGRLGECHHWSARALGLLAERDQGSVKELALQQALATSAMFTRGNDHMVAAAIERALALAEAFGEPLRQMHLLAGLHIFLMRTGAFDESLEVARRGSEIATRLGSPEAQVTAEWMLGTSYHLVGRQKDAQRHCERGFALAAASLLGNIFGYDHRLRTFFVMARCLWIQGRWDRGVAWAREAIQEAERQGSLLELCIALIYSAPVLLWNGSLDEAEAVIERLIIHADRHALRAYQACGQALRGELLCARGRHEEAVDCLRGALARLHDENHLIMNSHALCALAESLMHLGRLEQALMVIDEAIDRAERSGGNFALPELLRTQGEIRLQSGDSDGAEAALLAAVALADEQAATSWRLRSGEALARLWMSRGRIEQAQTEVSSLLALLEDCGAGEPLAPTRERLLTLRAALERPVPPTESSQAQPGSALIRAPREAPPLPPRLSYMVGRDQTIAALVVLLRERRFVSVIGPGGMGKTTVATAVAHELADSFEGQVAFVDLATLADPGLVIAFVSAAVGATLTEPDPLVGLLAFVANRRMLLVLDNCEHLADAVAALARQLYTRASELHLLVTSREPLRTEGEQVHALEPLEGPPDHPAGASELIRYPTVQLFMERAAASGYREPLDDVTAPLVAVMCRRLDGIALAIELVASRLGTYGVQGTAGLLENRFRLLWQGRRSALPRHQTLHAMLDWSFNLLSERDRTLLAQLGVFAGPFDLAGVRAVAGGDGGDGGDAFTVEQSLDNLVEKSLVWTSASAGSILYRLPHITRDFALVELTRRGAHRAVGARHARHVLSLLQAVPAPEPLDETAPAPPISPTLLPCLRAALTWCFSEEGDRELSIDLVVAAAPTWLRIGLLGECRNWSHRALERLPDRDKGGVKELALQEALAASAMFTRGNDGVVAAAIDRGLVLAEALGQVYRQMHLLSGRQIFLVRIGEYDEAVEVSRRALDIAGRLGSTKAEIMAEWMLGTSYHFVGQQADAQLHCDRGFSLEASRAVEFDVFGFDHRIRAFIVLTRSLWIQGRWDHGLAFGRKAIANADRRGYPVGVCIALIYTATALLWNGSLDEAAEGIERLEELAERHALAPYRACGRALRGQLLCAQGRHEAAIECLRSALPRFIDENHRIMDSGALRALAESLTHVGHLEEAQTVIDDAIGRAEQSGGKFNLSELLRTRSEIRLQAGDPDGAEAALLAAVAIADEQAAASWRLRSGEALARLWMSRGRIEPAQTEVSSLLALLEDCGPGELLAATRDRLLALRAGWVQIDPI